MKNVEVAICIFLAILFVQNTLATVCTPCEENRPCTLMVKLSTLDRKKVAWLMDNIIMSTCDTSLDCVDYFHDVTVTSVTSHDGGAYWMNHTLVNISRGEAGLWSLKYIDGRADQSAVLMQCVLTVYTRIEEVNCSELFTNHGVEITCTVKKVYPPAHCMFSVHYNQTQRVNASNITYIHEATEVTSFNYFNTQCKLYIPRRDLAPGAYRADVIAFPNLTGDVTDLARAARTSFHYFITEFELSPRWTNTAKEERILDYTQHSTASLMDNIPHDSEVIIDAMIEQDEDIPLTSLEDSELPSTVSKPSLIPIIFVAVLTPTALLVAAFLLILTYKKVYRKVTNLQSIYTTEDENYYENIEETMPTI